MSGVGRKFVGYGLTAGTAAIVDIGGYALLCKLGVFAFAAAVCSFCVAAVVNYLLTGRWVFRRSPSLRGFGLFFLAALSGLLVNVSTTLVAAMLLGIVPVLAKTIGVGTAFLVNFWVNLRVVFRDSSAQQPP